MFTFIKENVWREQEKPFYTYSMFFLEPPNSEGALPTLAVPLSTVLLLVFQTVHVQKKCTFLQVC